MMLAVALCFIFAVQANAEPILKRSLNERAKLLRKQAALSHVQLTHHLDEPQHRRELGHDAGGLTKRFEAEDAALTGSAKAPGSAVGWMDPGASATLTVDVPVGLYELVIRYASGAGAVGAAPRKVSLVVNDEFVETVLYPPTGNWGRYTDLKGPNIRLKEGSNKIGFVVDKTKGDDGLINLDYIELTPKGVMRFEAEDGELVVPARTATSNGITLVGWMDRGASATITAEVPAGYYKLHIRYASHYGTDDRKVLLVVNDADMGVVEYPVTGNWWRMRTKTGPVIKLEEGTNTIAFVVKGQANGLINLDYIDLIATSPPDDVDDEEELCEE